MFLFRSSRKSDDIEPHEILLDSLAKKREAELGISEKRLEVPLLRRILNGFLFVSIFLILVLFSKTFQFQIAEGKKFSELAKENKYILHQIQAERGVIYDRNLKQLVFNKPAFDLICQKNNLPQSEAEKEKVLREVSQILNKDFQLLKEKIEENENSQIVIAEGLSQRELVLLETKIKELPGFEIDNNTIRYYENGETFAHLIGYTGKIKAEELKKEPEFYSIEDWVGRTGVENYYEKILRRSPGKLRIERDARGNIISKEIISLPESGKSLILWLDSELQRKIEEELKEKLNELGTKKAVAVALDPETGGILSLVSLPSFDNNLFQKGANPETLKKVLEDPNKPLFNRAISGRYLTGSTIKPLIASAVLEEDIIDPNKKINCQGKITIPNPWIPNASSTKKDWTIHGWTDMRKAIAESCNVYFYTVGGGYKNQEGLGPTKIKEYLELFGWDKKTGIDLPGEIAGFIPDKEWKKRTWNQGWWDGDTYNLAIGQGYLQITPLEVVTAFAAIANNGKLYQPEVVKAIVKDKEGLLETIKEFKPKIIKENFISPENLQIVREGMRQAVTGKNSPKASAILLNSLPVEAAAKTGTAELGNDHYHNWITVFAPYDNPKIVLTLMIEDVEGIQAAVLPVAKSILEWYFSSEKK